MKTSIPAEFHLIDGATTLYQKTDLESILRFIMGEDSYWVFEYPPADDGISRKIYVPFHALAYITWSETELDRKRNSKEG